MHVLGIYDRIVGGYRKFAGGFVVHDVPVREDAGKRTADGYQWPTRWLSLRRGFASGGAIGNLASEVLLQPGA